MDVTKERERSLRRNACYEGTLSTVLYVSIFIIHHKQHTDLHFDEGGSFRQVFSTARQRWPGACLGGRRGGCRRRAGLVGFPSEDCSPRVSGKNDDDDLELYPRWQGLPTMCGRGRQALSADSIRAIGKTAGVEENTPWHGSEDYAPTENLCPGRPAAVISLRPDGLQVRRSAC